MSTDKIRFWLNDVLIEENGVSPTTSLLYYARQQRDLTGTKEGCNEGDCGACTVVVVDVDGEGKPAFRAVNSCLVLLPMVHGKRVYTVEALRRNGEHHPVQTALVEELGSQCGYCTPGVIMSMFEGAYRDDLGEDWQLDDQMCGNLCRCTGYRPIMDAAKAVAGTRPDDRFAAILIAATDDAAPESLHYTRGDQRFFYPTSLDELWDVLDANDDARIVNGGTDLSLEVTKQFKALPCLVSLEGIAVLNELEVAEDGTLTIGSNARLSALETLARDGWVAIERMLRFFGARQIKNRGTVGGNLCTASPIGDMAPVLVSLDATAIVTGRGGERRMPLEDFLVGYRQTALARGEILAAVEVPPVPAGVRSVAYKVSKRQELDISTVAAGFWLATDDAGVVTEARFAFGGLSARPGARANGAEAAVVGKPWTEAAAEAAAARLQADFTPIDDHRGSAWYRATVAANLIRGFYHETRDEPSPRLPYRPTGTVVV